ncbi:MAG: hypothetical protein AB6733_22425 [Clostridiaceae bacterium]
MSEDNLIGRVVKAKAGRDLEGFFIVVDIIDNDYVHIADGKSRKIENPKKKKIKHLQFTNMWANDIKMLLLQKEEVTNAKIRKYFKSVDIDKEVIALCQKQML